VSETFISITLFLARDRGRHVRLIELRHITCSNAPFFSRDIRRNPEKQHMTCLLSVWLFCDFSFSTGFYETLRLSPSPPFCGRDSCRTGKPHHSQSSFTSYKNGNTRMCVRVTRLFCNDDCGVRGLVGFHATSEVRYFSHDKCIVRSSGSLRPVLNIWVGIL
jgi:hypothetical protein